MVTSLTLFAALFTCGSELIEKGEVVVGPGTATVRTRCVSVDVVVVDCTEDKGREVVVEGITDAGSLAESG